MESDSEELYKWIDEHCITRPKRNISRDFSDAVPLVEILKHHFPKLVQLHNYSPQNSLSRKLSNWYTLNRKVLTKLRMSLSNETMEDLAQAKPGVIEKVLYDIKRKIEARGKEGDKNDCLILEGLSDNSSGCAVIPVKVKSGTKFVDQKIVPADVFQKMENDVLEKNNEILELKNKLQHVESMLAIKDERIKDLTQQLNTIVNSSTSNPSIGDSCRSSKFFGGIY